MIQYLNAQKAFRLAVDIPSGLPANGPLLDAEAVIKANHTLTFQAPKLTFFLPETGSFVPYFEVLDIGLDSEFLATTAPLAQLIYKPQAQQFYQQRRKFSHKGTYGHAFIVGGSKGKMGAVTLSAKACLKTGAGLVTAYIPEGGNDILQTSLPEVMTQTGQGKEHLENISIGIQPSVIAIGMGMGQHEDTAKALASFLAGQKGPLVIDADALNILSVSPSLFEKLPENSILTPHPGELERMIGSWKNDFDKIEITKAFSKKYRVIVVIKGAHSLVIMGDQMYVNTTGNPGMATAGSGDVLSGMIAGLVCQGYPSLVATIFGVYLHGSAGNITSQGLGFEALTASDIISNIGAAFLELFRKEEIPQQEETPGE